MKASAERESKPKTKIIQKKSVKQSNKRPRYERFRGYDDPERKKKLMLEIELKRLQKAVERQEILIKNYFPPKEPVPKSTNKRKVMTFYDVDTSKWELRGAARPAPVFGAEPFNPHLVNIGGENLFALEGESFIGHPECKSYLELKNQLGLACLALHRTKDAVTHFKRCIELDETDSVAARHGLIRAFLDQNKVEDARFLSEKFAVGLD